MVLAPGSETTGQPTELVACRSSLAEDTAYERILTDAMAGDPTLFAREDYVEEAWRIVDPLLKTKAPAYPYDPGTWGPKEVEPKIVPPGGWSNPVVLPPEGQEMRPAA